MHTLRLLADDLTGALDSAARFVPLTGPVPVVWSADGVPATAAFDSATRDADAAEAVAAVTRLAPLLTGADIAFKKIDSLLRGHVAAELAACAPLFDRCILAPAFPFQGRITRGHRQWMRTDGRWQPIALDLANLHPRVEAHDAETDADLRAIVAGAGKGRILWCGTGGLAGALTGNRPVPCPALPRPILALIGSDHAVSAAQLAALGERHLRLPDASPAAIAAALAQGGAAVSVTLPPGTRRDDASRRIDHAFAGLLRAIGRPGTLCVAGGETLRALCDTLGADGLLVEGEIEPGIPISRLRGGTWDGQRIVSKSGAFGPPDCLLRLLTAA